MSQPTLQQALAELGYSPSADLIAAFEAALESSTVTVQAGETLPVQVQNESQDIILRNATLGGPTNFQPYDAQMSVHDIDTASTSVTGGARIGKTTIGKADKFRLSLRNPVDEVPVKNYPGQIMTIALRSASNSTCSVDARLTEYH